MRKKINNFLLSAATLLALASCASQAESTLVTDYTKYVDPHIGTGAHGHVIMAANVPFGFVQLGPSSIPEEEWDWTSGYHISDTTIIGFSHTHLSGTGIGDLFDVTLMPVTGEVKLERGVENDPNSGMWSYFTRKNEEARAGYYKTHLDRFDIGVELTATERVGIHRYNFPQGAKDAAVMMNLVNGSCWDDPVMCSIEAISDTEFAGKRYSTGWANDQRLYYVMEFSRPVTSYELYDDQTAVKGSRVEADSVYGRFNFDMSKESELLVKVAFSAVSIENARMNLKAEAADWDFDTKVAEADAKWQKELSRIQIATNDESIKEIFYTAMYHTMVAPSVYCDVNGDYRGSDMKIYKNADYVNYTTFSLWDTYRAAHPLMTIIHPEKVDDMINTMLNINDQQGKLPIWHLMGCETDCMKGNPGVIVVADALVKGFDGFDHKRALDAMVKSSMLDIRGMDLLKKHGYIPSDLYNESIAECMELAIADASIAKAAAKLGDKETADYFAKRSKSYSYYLDPETKFMRGRFEDGSWRTPFDPYFANHTTSDYTEGNAWQYTWMVPHDLEGLTSLMGGADSLVAKLDSTFEADTELDAEASVDMSGLIGQYVHGNEPSHHAVYFYTMLGRPEKAADRLREIMTTLYTIEPDGICGNEDVGQMSAWYILSSMGFYQVDPADGRYYFGTPIVDEARLDVGNGKTFTVKALGNSAENRYIQSITLNGKPLNTSFVTYADIMAGGEMVYTMGSTPAVWY